MFCSVAGAAHIIVCIQHDGQQRGTATVAEVQGHSSLGKVNCFVIEIHFASDARFSLAPPIFVATLYAGPGHQYVLYIVRQSFYTILVMPDLLFLHSFHSYPQRSFSLQLSFASLQFIKHDMSQVHKDSG
jgi:hypothetical protein